jgi:UDP-MurNAc hydroxylase
MMAVEFLGHASTLIRTERTSILIDPVFGHRHHCGLYEHDPPREFKLDILPAVSALVVSHRHLDHLDVDTLRLMPRAMPVFIPADAAMQRLMAGLGFEQVVSLSPLSEVVIDDLVLIPTPSADGAVEMGCLIKTAERTVWNLVDTAPPEVSVASIRAMQERVDLAIVPWQPLLDGDVARGAPAVFPLRSYSRLLANARATRAASLVLGACDFRATDDFSWLNDVTFPVSRRRFIRDAVATNKEWRGRILCPRPGDAIDVGDDVSLRAQGLEYCRSTREFRDYEWRPWASRFRTRAHSLKTDSGRDRQRVELFFADLLLPFIRMNCELFASHRTWRVSRTFEVHFRDTYLRWTLKFDDGTVELVSSETEDPNSYTIITADALIALQERTRDWSFVVLSGDYWEMDFTYGIAFGDLVVPTLQVFDPLRMLFGGDDHFNSFLDVTSLSTGCAPHGP